MFISFVLTRLLQKKLLLRLVLPSQLVYVMFIPENDKTDKLIRCLLLIMHVYFNLNIFIPHVSFRPCVDFWCSWSAYKKSLKCSPVLVTNHQVWGLSGRDSKGLIRGRQNSNLLFPTISYPWTSPLNGKNKFSFNNYF